MGGTTLWRVGMLGAMAVNVNPNPGETKVFSAHHAYRASFMPALSAQGQR